MNRFRPLFLLIVALVLVLSITSAGPADFEASAPKDIRVCGCDTITKEVIVINSGLFSSFYNIAQTADISEISPSHFVLEPGESIVLSEIINAPCGEEGKRTVKTTIKSDLGISKSFEQDINIGMCSNAGLKVFPVDTIGCRCSDYYYQVEVQNTDGFVDTFTLQSSQPEITTIAPRQFRLEAFETATAYVTVSPSCDISGHNTVDISVSSLNGADSTTSQLRYLADAACFTEPQPESDAGSSFLVWFIPLLPLILIVLLIIVGIATLGQDRPKHSKPATSGKQKDENYWWESKYPDEPKEQKDHSILLIVLGIILLLSLIFLTSLYVVQNVDVNDVTLSIDMGNETLSNDTIDVEPDIEMNETEPINESEIPKEGMLPPGIGPLLWLILILVIVLDVIAYLKYRRHRQQSMDKPEPKEAKKSEKKPEKPTKVAKKKAAKKIPKKFKPSVNVHLPSNALLWKIPVLIAALIILAVVWFFRGPIRETAQANNTWTFWIVVGGISLIVLVSLWVIRKKPSKSWDPPTTMWPLLNLVVLAAIVLVLALFFPQVNDYLKTQATLAFYVTLGLAALAVVLAALQLRKK